MRKGNLKTMVILFSVIIALITTIATIQVLAVPPSESTSNGNGDEWPPC
ncbi:MAG: hypothetical protein ACFE8L_11780 [Candidatus Hodarchaeota archaeon]